MAIPENVNIDRLIVIDPLVDTIRMWRANRPELVWRAVLDIRQCQWSVIDPNGNVVETIQPTDGMWPTPRTGALIEYMIERVRQNRTY